MREFIMHSWALGVDIIEYLAITLHYTDFFFTASDVKSAIKGAERKIGLKKKSLWHEYKYTKKCLR